jgi:hypothetical protein
MQEAEERPEAARGPSAIVAYPRRNVSSRNSCRNTGVVVATLRMMASLCSSTGWLDTKTFEEDMTAKPSSLVVANMLARPTSRFTFVVARASRALSTGAAAQETHFGFTTVPFEKKQGMVNDVFTRVAERCARPTHLWLHSLSLRWPVTLTHALRLTNCRAGMTS